jgi:hypothetical protein
LAEAADADPVVMAADINARAFQEHDGFLYYYRDGDFDDQVVRTPLGGGSEELLFELSRPVGFLAVGDIMYVGNREGIYRAPLDGSVEPELLMVSPEDYPSLGEIRTISIYEERLYWTSDNPSVGWLDLASGECDTIVELGVLHDDELAAWGNAYYTHQGGIGKITP